MVLYCRVTENLVSNKPLTRIQPRLHQPHPTPSPTPSPTPAQTPTMLPTYIQSHLHFTFALNKHPALICIQPQLNLNNEHITFPPPLKAYLPPPSPLYSSASPNAKRGMKDKGPAKEEKTLLLLHTAPATENKVSRRNKESRHLQTQIFTLIYFRDIYRRTPSPPSLSTPSRTEQKPQHVSRRGNKKEKKRIWLSS